MHIFFTNQCAGRILGKARLLDSIPLNHGINGIWSSCVCTAFTYVIWFQNAGGSKVIWTFELWSYWE